MSTSSSIGPFKTTFAENIFKNKYSHDGQYTWYTLAEAVVDDVCGSFQGKEDPILSKDERQRLVKLIQEMKFIPGGRYLYYAGRPFHAWNNCYLFRGLEDTREEWGRLCQVSSDALMTGGGIGHCYSVFREKNALLKKTGGKSSGPIPLAGSINEIGRNVMQGGSRRSAIYASLHYWHPDIMDFIKAKDWKNMPIGKATKNGRPYTIQDAKMDDFNYPAPFDMTNMSVNYDEGIGDLASSPVFVENCRMALSTGEPGFSFNFGKYINEVLRNACTEVTSEDDSDMCNLGSLNMGEFDSIEEFIEAIILGAKFLICGSVRAKLPGAKFYEVRERNRRIGLGLMGVHEWLIARGYKYEVVEELHKWLNEYQFMSEYSANELCAKLGISKPKGYRALAPTGTIGIMASTTTSMEPMFAVALKRRYLEGGSHWKYEYVVDATAEHMIRKYGVNPLDIETASSLAVDFERRIKFQYDIQKYVDMSISSTINLPEWGSEYNNEDLVIPFAKTLAKYAPGLRGFTCYPNGARGGQPLTAVDYDMAKKHKGVKFDEFDVCDIMNRGGTCGS